MQSFLSIGNGGKQNIVLVRNLDNCAGKIINLGFATIGGFFGDCGQLFNFFQSFVGGRFIIYLIILIFINLFVGMMISLNWKLG